MGVVRLTPIERAVLEWFSSQYAATTLEDQIGSLEVHDREYTGAGSFTTFVVSGSHTPYTDGVDGHPLDGPWIDGAPLTMGASTLLWLEKGIVQCLEIAATGSHFPEADFEFVLIDNPESGRW